MARDEFDSAGEYVQIKDLEGELVLFTPREHVQEVQTSFGEKDAVVADLVVLSQEGQPEYEDVMVFQGALIAALKRRIKVEKSIERDAATGVVTNYATTTSRRVLGVIAKGDAKKGQSAPFVLDPATDEQKDLARAYVADNPAPAPVKKMVSQQLALAVNAAPSGQDAPVAPQAVPHVDEFAPSALASSVPDEDDPFATGDPFAVKQ